MSQPAATPKERIIVAEDSAPNRKIVCHLLEKLGYEVVPCEDGQLAWEAVQGPGNEHLVAIISDIMMPNMDGIQLLKKVRENESTKNLPVILVTAVSDRDYIMDAKNSSVNGYILKPVTFQRITQKLQEIFPDKQFPKAA